MRGLFRRGFGASVRVMAACAVLASAVAIVKAQQCDITITSPKPGDKVGETGTVEGKATISEKGHLWILAHRTGSGDWWPQGQGPATVAKGAWEVTVFYGRARDVGSRFEVAVVVVGEADNQRLRQWVSEAPEKDYPGTGFPNTVDGCPIRKVTVLKTRH